MTESVLQGSLRRQPSNGSWIAREHRIKAWQGARGIAALLVVLCHTAAFIGEEPALWHRIGIYLWLRGTALGVQLFFVLSGIVIFTVHRADIDQPSKARGFYWKRFRRIYPLYWIFFLLTMLRHHAAGDAGFAYQRDPWTILSGFLLLHLFSYQTHMVVAWTLFDEVQFYLVFSVLLLNRKIGSILLFLWMAASLLFLMPSGPYWLTMFSPNHLLFGLGILVAQALNGNRPMPARLILWSGVVLFGISVALSGQLTRGVGIHLAGGVGAAGMLLGASLLEREGRLTIPHWLVLVGDASYSIYLVHFMVISAVARFSYSRWHQLPIPIGVWMVLLFVCGTGAGLATYFAIERPLLRLLGKH